MNAKYISSSAVNNQYFHECLARVYVSADIFTALYIFGTYRKRTVNFPFILYSVELVTESKTNFLVVSLLIWKFQGVNREYRLVFTIVYTWKMAKKNILTYDTEDVSLLRKSFKCTGLRIDTMCKLTIAKP